MATPAKIAELEAQAAQASPEAMARPSVVGRFRLIRPRANAAADPQTTEKSAVTPTDAVNREEALLAAWLAQLVKANPHLVQVNILDFDTADGRCVAGLPSQDAPPTNIVLLGKRAVEAKRYVVEEANANNAGRVLAVPMVFAGLPKFALLATAQRQTVVNPVVDLKPLFEGLSWLRLLRDALPATAVLQPAAAVARSAPGSSAAALDILAATLGRENLATAAMSAANSIAEMFKASRVAIGLLDGKQLQLLAMSGMTDFRPGSELGLALTQAMSEAMEQGVVLVAPEEASHITRDTAAQRRLLEKSGGGAIATIPFSDAHRIVGAVSLEWNADRAPSAADRDRMSALVQLLGPVLALSQAAHLSLGGRVRAAATASARKLMGPRHPLLKIGGIGAALLLCLAMFISGAHRVTGDAVLRGSVQRVVLAPVDGFVASAPSRPGDEVKAGQVLAALDDKALQLEVVKWQSEYDQVLNDYREAMAVLDSAKVSVLRAELDRAEAEMQLAEDNLDRSEIRAPIDGVVVSGDLSQSIGAPVERGQTLFELAPLKDYRVSIRVPEGDVRHLAAKQRGRLVLQAFPDSGFDVVIDRVTPVSEMVDGKNVFEVEAVMLNPPAKLRPGMQGVAKLEVGQKRWIWLWTHDVMGWLRYQAWKFGLWGAQ